ncbi:conserved phage C-terminal domain-containing protein [Vibrio fluvialis]|uniref:conserved phage C-terminal domain-containing protein n=1 Tax=Vibrio fluvialis TaxID=676 RepID=UPI002380A50B|nr:conserved phage C-terminal domain-containing protein [Vibrio fluvialis]WDY54312.1 conserved phage C-terminal domain-containing protein [Vibrio fluvialis]
MASNNTLKQGYFAPFFMVPNAIAQDYGLSLEAIGLWCFMRSKPHNWRFYKAALIKELKGVGRDKLERIIKELKEAGLLSIEQQRDAVSKQISYSWKLSDLPQSGPHTENPYTGTEPHTGLPCTGEPYTAEPDPVNPQLQIKEEEKTEEQKTEEQDLSNVSGFEELANDAIDGFNMITGSKLPKRDSSNRRLVMARLKEGYTVEDLASVFTYKNSEWKDNPEMAQYIRLSTLCASSKFDGYLKASKAWFAKQATTPKQPNARRVEIGNIQSRINSAEGEIKRLESYGNERVHGGAIESRRRQIEAWQLEIRTLQG